jgi:hypothetical protein
MVVMEARGSGPQAAQQAVRVVLGGRVVEEGTEGQVATAAS